MRLRLGQWMCLEITVMAISCPFGSLWPCVQLTMLKDMLSFSVWVSSPVWCTDAQQAVSLSQQPGEIWYCCHSLKKWEANFDVRLTLRKCLSKAFSSGHLDFNVVFHGLSLSLQCQVVSWKKIMEMMEMVEIIEKTQHYKQAKKKTLSKQKSRGLISDTVQWNNAGSRQVIWDVYPCQAYWKAKVHLKGTVDMTECNRFACSLLKIDFINYLCFLVQIVFCPFAYSRCFIYTWCTFSFIAPCEFFERKNITSVSCLNGKIHTS